MVHAEAMASPPLALWASGPAAQAATVCLLQQYNHLLQQHEQVPMATKLEYAKTTWLEQSENELCYAIQLGSESIAARPSTFS